jgi:hypothetical protein
MRRFTLPVMAAVERQLSGAEFDEAKGSNRCEAADQDVATCTNVGESLPATRKLAAHISVAISLSHAFVTRSNDTKVRLAAQMSIQNQ